MKILSYKNHGVAHVGLVSGDGVADLTSRLQADSVRELLDRNLLAQARNFENANPDRKLADIEFLPVIPDPPHLICVGINYLKHLEEVQGAGVARQMPKQPSLFLRLSDTLVAHNAPLLMPKMSNDFDYEAELAIIIGKGGRFIDEKRALDHVAGYSCFNDASVRDWQFHSSQVTPGKNFPATGGFGPWMVTSDEVDDPHKLSIKLVLNGKTMQDGNTSDLIFSIPKIIAYISQFVALKPGDVIATGTPAGVGFSRKPPVFMKAGDICEVHIEKVGVLRNPVAKDTA
jgi:2-keto-4-pentenoate hydratase/2-oxohepta-3-ene-1,7-dioic acid hydratase in catechol pathway